MGQKVNPIGFRTGRFYTWNSRWFLEKGKYGDYLIEDIKIRRELTERLKIAGLTNVEIERLPKSIKVIVTVSRPGVVIGRGGSGLEDLKKYILEVLRKTRKDNLKDIKIDIKVNEVNNPESSASIVAQRIVSDMERRMKHRAVVNRAMDRVMQAGALGVKIILAGRIEGADISRVEKYRKGSVPAQTLRANIDYAQVPALLKKGYVGVKVYIHKKKED